VTRRSPLIYRGGHTPALVSGGVDKATDLGDVGGVLGTDGEVTRRAQGCQRAGARLGARRVCGARYRPVDPYREGSLVGPSIRPVSFTGPDGSEGTDLYLDRDAFHEAFAADVDPDTAAVMAAAQRPYAAAAFAGTPSGPLAWKTLPCWYLLGTEDKAIPPALQRFMAERANATIVEVPVSHVSFVSQPEAATSSSSKRSRRSRRRPGAERDPVIAPHERRAC